MPQTAYNRVRLLRFLLITTIAASFSNGILAQDRTKEAATSNYVTGLNGATDPNNESDTLVAKQHLTATLKQNTLEQRLISIDKQIEDMEQGRPHSSTGLKATTNAPPVTLKELQKCRKQIMKELSKLRSGNKTTHVDK